MKKMILAGACALASLPLLASDLTPSPSPRVPRPAQVVNLRRADGARSRHTLDPNQNEGINVDVIGRVNGGGGVLFKTSLDVSNNTTDSTRVDFFALLKDQVNGHEFEIDGGIVNAGVAAAGGGQLAGISVAHFDDFIDALRNAPGGLTAQEESDGVLGSLVLQFYGFTPAFGKASAEARFYSSVPAGNGSLSGGTIGVSLNGHEFTDSEPTSLVGIVRNTVGEANTPQLYTNFFICNEGYVDSSGLVGQLVTLRLTGYSNSTGAITGTFTYPSLSWGQTAVIGNVFSLLGGNPSKDDTLLVFVDIVSGNSAISGASAKNDNITKDPSAAQLRPANF
ncbi:MAG: hypothetical protein ACRD16_01395 [Thermoanaerobaculia bacterium]